MAESAHPLQSWIEQNTTQARFAATADMSEPYLSEILSGKKTPSLKMAAKMSRATGGVVPIAAFLADQAQAGAA